MGWWARPYGLLLTNGGADQEGSPGPGLETKTSSCLWGGFSDLLEPIHSISDFEGREIILGHESEHPFFFMKYGLLFAQYLGSHPFWIDSTSVLRCPACSKLSSSTAGFSVRSRAFRVIFSGTLQL